MKNLVIIIALLTFGLAQSAQKFYKWTDEEGNTHYTSEKPEDKQTKEVNVKTHQPKVSQKTTNPSQEQQEPDESTEKSYMEKYYEKKEKTKELAKENKKSCLDAKTTLAKYQEKVRMSQVDKKTGKKVYLEDSKRYEIIDTAEKGVKKYCI